MSKLYPTYKCRMCGHIETDYADAYENLYNRDMRLQSQAHKIHVCEEFDGCKNIGVMELIGYHQRDDN